ncbi:LacI family DNA-binding transcriptional regulator [Streptacidiphilus sp. N1-12]|uniref:LacI family DNA-binding transcriptional regulator n=2 Tax=Streptacidiphilus alkalitolerans TaxID=3342712 RepID=A0ABV6WSJ4_9ACTN
MPATERGPRPRRATLADVAALAGVTPGTASKALNGRGRLRPETRQRVLDAAEQLRFQPSAAAQSLLSGRSWTVGLITTDSIGRFGIPVLLGAEDALGAGRTSVLLCDTRGDAIRERHHLQALTARGVDGIIVAGRRTDPRRPLPGPMSVPVVYALGPSTDPGDISVVSDDAHGVHLAVRHLADSGRTRVAHVTGPEHHAAAAARAHHTRRALREFGIGLATGRVHYGEWSETWGRQAADIVLRAQPDCDAFFCGNDQIGRGVADALRESGHRVPQDIAVIGYDNWEVMALAARPPLTTVDTNLLEVGRTAALRLMDAIEGSPHHGIESVPCRLVIRDSTGPSATS